MVRATARNNENGLLIDKTKLPGTESVYRKLGQTLCSEANEIKDGDSVHTRFVVDVLSGTSAGDQRHLPGQHETATVHQPSANFHSEFIAPCFTLAVSALG